ncbi:hypothetical protein K1719_046246 [Acacia pycnantha]|nr:hypothetical protein K1719_046246 [Acacia pycnantha]
MSLSSILSNLRAYNIGNVPPNPKRNSPPQKLHRNQNWVVRTRPAKTYLRSGTRVREYIIKERAPKCPLDLDLQFLEETYCRKRTEEKYPNLHKPHQDFDTPAAIVIVKKIYEQIKTSARNYNQPVFL